MITEPAFGFVPVLSCAESVITLCLLFVIYWLLVWLYLDEIFPCNLIGQSRHRIRTTCQWVFGVHYNVFDFTELPQIIKWHCIILCHNFYWFWHVFINLCCDITSMYLHFYSRFYHVQILSPTGRYWHSGRYVMFLD